MSIDLSKITLDTKLYHYYLDIKEIVGIDRDKIKATCNCKFLSNTFNIVFVNDNNHSGYNKEYTRHISELSLEPFK